MPDLSDTLRKCRIGTAKNFTLLLLLYITQPEAQGIYNSLLNYNDELEQQLQSASTQQEMNEITAQMYQNSDDSLNQIWHIVKYNSDETEFAQILEEQKSWITEKEAEAEQIRAANNGSSAEMDVNIKLNDLTEERCRELLEYLKN